MNITQTKSFKIDLEHLTKLCNEYRYLVQRIDILTNSIERIKKYRGENHAIQLVKKVNQKCRCKHFIVTNGKITVNKDINK